MLATHMQLLVFLVGIYRYAGDEIDARLAKSEADIMCNAIKSNDFNHEEIVRIITTRSKTQLRATLNRYKDDNGSSLTKVIISSNSNRTRIYTNWGYNL